MGTATLQNQELSTWMVGAPYTGHCWSKDQETQHTDGGNHS